MIYYKGLMNLGKFMFQDYAKIEYEMNFCRKPAPARPGKKNARPALDFTKTKQLA